MIFINTWHNYGHLIRELDRWHPHVRKFIVIRCTETDGDRGETLRRGQNGSQQSRETGIPVDYIWKGVKPAIKEFLSQNHPRWIQDGEWKNNHGLIALRRCEHLYPITFSIPACKIVKHVPNKTKIIAQIVPGDTSTYGFSTEESYYKDYQDSVFGLTRCKGGWDCMRHYEILANGCIPKFEGLNDLPRTTMINWPRAINRAAMEYLDGNVSSETLNSLKVRDYTQQLLDYTRRELTTKAVARYFLDTVSRLLVKPVRSVLFLNFHCKIDYLRCMLVHGCKEVLGGDCHEYPQLPHLYTDFKMPKNIYELYGGGMSVSRLFDRAGHREDSRDATVLEDIAAHRYDIVVYGHGHSERPLWAEVSAAYKTQEIVLMCGLDFHKCDLQRLADRYPVFVREL
jgi:hypothetical protein